MESERSNRHVQFPIPPPEVIWLDIVRKLVCAVRKIMWQILDKNYRPTS